MPKLKAKHIVPRHRRITATEAASCCAPAQMAPPAKVSFDGKEQHFIAVSDKKAPERFLNLSCCVLDAAREAQIRIPLTAWRGIVNIGVENGSEHWDDIALITGKKAFRFQEALQKGLNKHYLGNCTTYANYVFLEKYPDNVNYLDEVITLLDKGRGLRTEAAGPI